MGVNYGPKVVKDNLLLYLDMYNPNSYLGEPTENLLVTSGSGIDFSIQGRNPAEVNPAIKEGDWYRLSTTATPSGSMGYRLYINNGILINGDTYTISLELYNDNIYSVNFHMDWCDSGGALNITMSPNERRTVAFTGTRATYDSTYRFLDICPTTPNCTILARNPQIEHKSHVTPFVNGVRSAVDGWRDLSAYKRHFDISNPLFDNNGLPYFDGAITDFVPATCNSLIDIPHGSEWSINLWYKIPSTSLRPGGAVIGRAGTSPNLWVNTLAVPSWRDGNGTYLYFDNIPYAINTWINLTLTCDTSSNITMTYNGSISETKVSTNGKLYIDRIGAGYSSGGNYHPFGGYVGIIQVYNRLLSPTEISQNFNALRGRFSV